MSISCQRIVLTFNLKVLSETNTFDKFYQNRPRQLNVCLARFLALAKRLYRQALVKTPTLLALPYKDLIVSSMRTVEHETLVSNRLDNLAT